MKKFAKLALGAVLLAGASTAMVATPAEARVTVGIGIGGPGAYYGPAYYPRSYSCDPYSRWYDPYYCGAYAPAYVYGPSFYTNFHTGWGGWRGGYDRGWNGGGNFHGGGGYHGGGNHGGGNHGGGHGRH